MTTLDQLPPASPAVAERTFRLLRHHTACTCPDPDVRIREGQPIVLHGHACPLRHAYTDDACPACGQMTLWRHGQLVCAYRPCERFGQSPSEETS